MTEIAVGIDVGTSYTKAVAVRLDGTVVRESRVESRPRWDSKTKAPIEAYQCWVCLKEVVRALLSGETSAIYPVTALCVSGIAPTLTVFDASNLTRAYSIPYSSLAGVPDGSVFSQTDRTLTDHRVAVLRELAAKERFAIPCITDLVGYLNCCLTGETTINSISLVEMGMLAGKADCEELSIKNGLVPRLVAPGQLMGETSRWSAAELGIKAGLPVCGGCPDTLGSVVGAGLELASETMLYLGTFGSFLHLEDDVDRLLDEAPRSGSPFSWMLSVPGLGPEIEALSQEWFGPGSVASRLQAFDSAATRSAPGAAGTLFLVPRWKNGMKAVGKFSFASGRDRGVGDVPRRSRAVLESLGYALLIIGGQPSGAIRVSGGGARSRPWLEALSTVLGADILVQSMAWESAGTADIAARFVSRGKRISRAWHRVEQIVDSGRELINDNLCRATELYHSYGWV